MNIGKEGDCKGIEEEEDCMGRKNRIGKERKGRKERGEEDRSEEEEEYSI
jgi:hypothetical protein